MGKNNWIIKNSNRLLSYGLPLKSGTKRLTIDGHYANKERVIGFCHSKLHKAYLTKKQAKNHNCKCKTGHSPCERFQRWGDNKN